MKKLLLFLVTMMLPMVAYADDSGTCGESLTWYYEGSSKTLTISGTGEMFLPSIGESPWMDYRSEIVKLIIEEGVTSIDYYAFTDCINLISISLPNSLLTIGGHALSGCSGIVSINIPNSVTSIGVCAFQYCTGIISINIPKGVTTIENFTFQGCSALTSVALPSSIKSIEYRAFDGCNSLTTLVIPESLRSIDERAFEYCDGLTSVTFPNGDISIGESVFYGCNSLTSVHIPNITEWCKISFSNFESNPLFYAGHLYLNGVEINDLEIPNNVTKIDNNAFAGFCGMNSVSIPNSVTSISKYAFMGCNSLVSVTIPNSVTVLGEGAFEGCMGLLSVSISNNVSAIKSYTFEGCSALKSIEIPSSVTSIGICAFRDCPELSEIIFNNGVTNIEEGAFLDCKGLINLTLPNSIVSIGIYAFERCTNLTSLSLSDNLQIIRNRAFEDCISLKKIVIPKKVEYIYQEAFKNCTSLEGVEVLAEKPPFLYDNSFSNFSISLKVPKGCKEAYQTAQGWKNFTNISDADKYNLTYKVDNEVYKSYEIEEDATITPEPAPIKEGYTFSGWSEIPETMPAHDVTVTGTFNINSYKLTYMIDDKVYKETMYEYGATIIPEPQPEGNYDTFEWIDLPQTMPAHDVVVYASYTSGIIEVLMASQQNLRIYSPNGKKLSKLQKGLNIVILDDGTVKKIVIK